LTTLLGTQIEYIEIISIFQNTLQTRQRGLLQQKRLEGHSFVFDSRALGEGGNCVFRIKKNTKLSKITTIRLIAVVFRRKSKYGSPRINGSADCGFASAVLKKE
jgi:hypothetical protein